MIQWLLDDFSKKVYNDEYISVDPDYVKVRPEANANNINQIFSTKKKEIKHLDYGSGLPSDLITVF